jgi:hypothetical protein
VQGSTNNATCFLGPSRRYDPFTRSFMSLVPGQGHFGPDAIPGDARWRRGESVSLKVRTGVLHPALQSYNHAMHARTPSQPPPPHSRLLCLHSTDGPRQHGVARAGPARADGLRGALSSGHRRLRFRSRFPPTQLSKLSQVLFPTFSSSASSASSRSVSSGLPRRNSFANASECLWVIRVCVYMCAVFARSSTRGRHIRSKKSFWRR